jgi:hypothetical protein
MSATGTTIIPPRQQPHPDKPRWRRNHRPDSKIRARSLSGIAITLYAFEHHRFRKAGIHFSDHALDAFGGAV